MSIDILIDKVLLDGNLILEAWLSLLADGGIVQEVVRVAVTAAHCCND